MTTTTTETPTTDEVIVGMLTENTGRHFLDSGGAYGRNWERNQGHTVEDFRNVPEASLDKYGCLTIDVFHFLSERLDYDEDLDRLFSEFMADRPDTNWLQDMEEFPAWLAENHGDEYGTEPRACTVNTYNNEDALSQVLQYSLIAMDGGNACYGEFVLLQIHGGCDARGGYTRPRAFRTGDAALFDNARATMACAGPVIDENQCVLDGVPGPSREHHVWYTENAGYSWHNENWPEKAEDITDVEALWDEDAECFLCPECETKLSVYAWPAG